MKNSVNFFHLWKSDLSRSYTLAYIFIILLPLAKRTASVLWKSKNRELINSFSFGMFERSMRLQRNIKYKKRIVQLNLNLISLYESTVDRDICSFSRRSILEKYCVIYYIVRCARRTIGNAMAAEKVHIQHCVPAAFQFNKNCAEVAEHTYYTCILLK